MSPPVSHLSHWWASHLPEGMAGLTWWENGWYWSAWGRLVPDSQRGRAEDWGTTVATSLPASLLRDQSLSDTGRVSDLQNRLFAWRVGGRFLVFHVKLFLKTGFFSRDCFRNLKA